MKKLLLLFSKTIFLILLFCSTGSKAQQPVSYRFRHLTVDNGLSHTDATSVLQDEKGFIWIGTFSGLNRHDGYSTKVYYNNIEGSQTAYLNRIADMQLCTHNCLWMATEGGLSLFMPSTLSYKKIIATNANTAATLKEPLQKLIIAGNKLYSFSQKAVHLYLIGPDLSLTMLKDPFPAELGMIYNVKKDRSNDIWISHSRGIKVLTEKGSVKNLNFEDAAASMVTALFFDTNGELFFSNQKGIFCLPESEQQKILNAQKEYYTCNTATLNKQATYPPSLVYPNNLQKDDDGNFWLSTSGGLWKYIPSAGKFETYTYNEFERTSITSNSVNTVFIDRTDCLWMTTFGGGVNMVDLNQKSFQLLQRVPNTANTLSGNYIRALLEDSKGNLWIGTRNTGLNYYDFSSKKYRQFHPGNSGLQSDNVRSLAKDKDERLWIGTDVGISILHPGGVFENLKPGAGEGDAFAEGNYFSVAIDKFNQVWAGTWNNGLSRIVYTGKNKYYVERLKVNETNKSLSSDRITFIYTDQDRPEVLVGTDHGLNHIFLNNDGSVASVKNYHTNTNNTLSSEFVWPIIRQGDSVIWVGTLGGGLNKINLKKNGGFEIVQVMDNNVQALRDVESMLMDNSGNLWLAGKMLTMYNPVKKDFVYYDVNDGLQGNSFKIGAAYKAASGRLYFGGINGVNYFDPAAITSNQMEPSVAFTELLVNGERLEASAADQETFRAISYRDKLQLSSSQNNFSIQFSAMHYANPERCKFRYKLDGYDKNWIYTDASNRFATYSNLDYGTYKLKVEAANNDGLWVGSGREMEIELLAPWWKTRAAKTAYLLMLAGILYVVWKYQHSWFNLKRKLQYRELEEKKQEEMHQVKLQFFTNISHEFRTPLTLILGPTEKMMQQETSEEERHNYLRLIYSNARRLLGLTNELMDFRQVETDSLKLQVCESDLDAFVTSISTEFRELAIAKDIVYYIKPPNRTHCLYFDPNIMEKVLVNLISNAFKYTEDNGLIEIEVMDSIADFKPKYKNHVSIASEPEVTDMVWIRIADTGIGITANSITNIFDRYFRVNTTGREKHLGTGVGLALVKSLLQLHKGTLHVYSERNEGTEFLIGLPSCKAVYKKIEVTDDTEFQIDFESLQYTIDWINEDSHDKQTQDGAGVKKDGNVLQRKRLLIVEDNHEMRRFLASSLCGIYDIIEAGSGITGLQKTKDYFPDLIISDLMMPDMDGNELCKAVRADFNISHIPFILITAKSSPEAHLEGLECGADVYFPKPFSLRLLQVTIHNLFEQRDKLKAKYNQDVFADARELVNNDRDKEFLDQFIAIIEVNMEDEELDVEMICRKIGMSRTKLYGKVKGVTGQPIGEFIRLLRLKRAARILVSEDIPIQQVMYSVGIQSQSYFTKAFKKEFGKTPSQFVADYSKKSRQNPSTEEM